MTDSHETTGRRLQAYERAYQGAPIGLLVVDTDLRIDLANSELAAITGKPRREHAGCTLRDVLPELAAELEPVLRNVIESGQPEMGFEIRSPAHATAGSERDWMVNCHPDLGPLERVVRVNVSIQDITERKQAERELRRSEQHLRAVIDNADVVLWAIDRNGTFTLSEGRSLGVLGLRPGEVVGRSLFDIYRDFPKITDGARRALKGEVVSHTVEVAGLVFQTQLLPLPREDGSPGGAIGVSIDVTERMRAVDALLESEERFREIAENIREALWLYDVDERLVVYVSPGYEKIWKRPAEKLYANSGEWDASVHPSDLETTRAAFARVLTDGGNERRTYRIVRPDGSERWIQDQVFAIRDTRRRVVRLVGVAEDVTEGRRAEEERRQLEAKVRHSQKLESLGILAGGIAHDFNNLLTGMLGNAELALEQLSPESGGREFIENIRATARHAAELTNQLLAYSGRGHFVVEPIDLNRLVREMSHLLRTVISRKAKLRVDLAPDLPAVEADAGQVRQVVMNLITNASEAIGQDDGTIHLRTFVFNASEADLAVYLHGDGLAPGRCVGLEVSDTGCGMDEPTRAKIFDPFFTTKFTGRGLGLAAVLGIARGHGAAVRVDSTVGQGTVFSFLFPPSTGAPRRAERARFHDGEDLAGRTVLVVDDDATVRDVAANFLRHAGARVLTAEDGLAGVETFTLHAEEVDVVLLDVTMPRLDGEEAFRRMREVRSDVRVVLSSGYSEQDTIARFSGPAPAGFVQKPYSSAALLRSIMKVLEDPRG